MVVDKLLQNVSSTDLSLIQAVVFALQNSRQLSVKSRHVLCSVPVLSLIPILVLSCNDSLKRTLLKASIHKIKMYGQSRSPCRIPLVGRINPDGSSLTRSE